METEAVEYATLRSAVGRFADIRAGMALLRH